MIKEAKISTLPSKKFIGQRRSMSFAKVTTFELWSHFMPRRKEIRNTVNNDLYSFEVYRDEFFKDYKPENEFDKWAAVEVSHYDFVPEGMETLTVPEGLYAVFLFKGSHTEATPFYTKIFMEWLPQSGYLLDNRPHFAVMGENYRKNDPNSEEDIWIPIRKP